MYHSFQMLHYKTPEYKVRVKVRGEPYFFGNTMRGTIRGQYFYGTAMAGAPVKWTLRRSVGSFRGVVRKRCMRGILCFSGVIRRRSVAGFGGVIGLGSVGSFSGVVRRRRVSSFGSVAGLGS